MITTVTLNASIDKAYFMEKTIKNGTVMRVASVRNSAGGKGLNVARTAKLCGAKVQATGFAGGYNGKYLQHLLHEDQIPHDFVEVDGETRSCINILDPGYHSTEYLEPGFELTPEDEQKFMDRFPEIIKDSTVVTISGSLPKGIQKDIYARMIQTAKESGKMVLLDSSGESLKHGLKALPTLVKPNQEELGALLGVEINTIQDVITYGRKLYETGIPYVVVSLGKDGALMICKEGIFHGCPPKVEAINPVGCGDSLLGAFAVALEQLQAPTEALRYAVSVATAKALSPNTGTFDPGQQKLLLEQITISRF